MLKTCGLVVGVEKKTNRKDKQRDEKISVQIEFVGSEMVVNRAGKAKILQKRKRKVFRVLYIRMKNGANSETHEIHS